MKKIVFCCLLFVGIVCIGCQNNNNSENAIVEEIEIEEVGTDENMDNADFAQKGKDLLDKGNIEEAIEQFNKALEKRKEAWIYGDLGRAKQEKKDLEGAIECYTEAIKINDKSAIYYDWRAKAYRELDKEDLAEEDQKIADELHAKGMD